MAWQERKISSWDDFCKFKDETYIPFARDAYERLYRGQSDAAWSLHPTLARLVKDRDHVQGWMEASEFEKTAAMEFEQQAHQYLSRYVLPDRQKAYKDKAGELWFLMQHYGVPTRVLDWTASCEVAAYFAIAENWEKGKEKDGAIWALDFRALNGGLMTQKKVSEPPSDRNIFDDAAPLWIYLVKAQVCTDRMVAQQCRFTMASHPQLDHSNIIDGAMSTINSKLYWKATIPHRLKREFLDRLRSMNIMPTSLFPGTDGIGRSLNELARIRVYKA